MAKGSREPFKILIACILSLRTKDQVTHQASQRLFYLADSPKKMLSLPRRQIEKAIYPVGFYRIKALRIHQISKMLLEKHHGQVPADLEALLDLPGVGRKTANLVLVEGFQKHGICVDTHVHRISNRWGYVRTRNPEETEFALRKILPKKYWLRYNEWLVSFGQTICQPVSPWCSRCPMDSWCAKRGVKHSR